MSAATVLAIYLHGPKGKPLASVEEAQAIPRCGLKGDRYFRATPGQLNPDQEITLIESEAFEAVQDEHGIALEPVEARRNLVTRGVRLNELVEKEFQVGEVRVRGRRFCQPCDHLESLTQPGVKAAFHDRGGLRAQIVEGGVIHVGDVIRTSA